LAGLVLGTVFTSREAWIATVVVVVLLAQWELYRALAAGGHPAAPQLGVAAGAVLLVGSSLGGAPALTFGLTMSVAATFLWFLADPDRAHSADRIGMTLLGIVYVPFLGAHVVLMRDLPSGPAVTIATVGLVALYDIGALVAGKTLGRHPIAPSVSPGKTLEGLGGGTLLVFILALAIGPFIGPFDALTAAGLAAVVAVVAPLGDLAESLIKRDLGIKDMGSILPGHGGLLDRVDGLLLVAPAAFWYLRVAVF
jgi:phosphatidate cytidylyltransferase